MKNSIFFFFALNPSDIVFILLINIKMPTIVGISTFMSRINDMLSWIEHKKSFINSGPNRVDPDEMPQNVAYRLGLHCYRHKCTLGNGRL